VVVELGIVQLVVDVLVLLVLHLFDKPADDGLVLLGLALLDPHLTS
jgi:hypothetical protein